MFIITTLLGIVVAGVGWWVKNIWAMLVAQQDAHNKMVLEFQKQLGALTLELGRDYLPRKDFERAVERLFARLDEIQAEVVKVQVQRGHVA
jgi:hypothetical protein